MTDPHLVIAVQLLDGISAAVLGVMFPLVVADITRGTGRFSLGLGIVGSAVGIGASLCTMLAGYLVDHIGRGATFVTLAAVAPPGLALVCTLMPETAARRRGAARYRASVTAQRGARPSAEPAQPAIAPRARIAGDEPRTRRLARASGCDRPRDSPAPSAAR